MSGDVTISGPYPALQFDATESGHTYFEDREIDGVMYRAQNASFNTTTLVWTSKISTKPSYALTQNADGSIGHLTKGPTSSPWTTWSGNGQRGVYDVRDFGASGDGSHDDTNAINLAATAASNAGGGIVYCPAGTYLISAVILLGSNTTLLGDGPGVTVLKAMSNMNGFSSGGPPPYTLNIAMIANSAYTSGSPSQTDIFVVNMTLNGNATGNVGTITTTTIINGLVTFNGVNNQGVYQCVLQSSSNDGILIMGTSTPAATGNFRVVDCTIDLASDFNPSSYSNVHGVAIHGSGIAQGFATRNFIGFGNLFLNPGYAVSGDAMDFINCPGLVVTNNQMTNCTGGIEAVSAVDVIISNNFVLSCTATGISSYISGSSGVTRLIVSNNLVDSPGSGGLLIAGSRSNAVISDNIVVMPSSSSSTAIAIGAQYVDCHDNNIDLNSSNGTAFYCYASHVTIAKNYVFNGNGAHGSGSVGINILTPQTDLLISDNNVADTATKLTLGSGLVTAITSSAIRNNEGINPYGGFGTLNPPVSMSLTFNPFPFDCMVYVANGGSVAVSVQGTSTNLGSGLGYLVPAGGKIQLSYGSTPSWQWIGS